MDLAHGPGRLSKTLPIMVSNPAGEDPLGEDEMIENQQQRDKEESENLFKVLTDQKMEFRVELEARTKQVATACCSVTKYG